MKHPGPRIFSFGFVLLGLLSLALLATAPALAWQAAPAADGVSEGKAPAHSESGKEAAGDENEAFKHSPSVRVVGRLLGLTPNGAYWFSVVLNFAIIAGLVFWGLRSNLPAMFRSRTESIRKAMDEARRTGEEAQQRLEGIEARLGKLDSEIAAMRATAEKEAATEEQRLRASADDDRKKIVESAEQEIASAAKAARRELTAHAADLAVTLAQKRIQVDAAADEALVRGFAENLGSGKGGN
jgi:F-type H+-transporting ATPase subunit b